MNFKRNILVLEDGVYNAPLLREYFRLAHYSYDLVTNCESACILSDNRRYDAALVDCQVYPHGESASAVDEASLAFLSHLSLKGNTLPVVITSDYEDNKYIIAEKAGLPFLSKNDWHHLLIPTLEDTILKGIHVNREGFVVHRY